MNTASKIAVLVPLCLVAGCRHKTQATTTPPAPAQIYTPNEVAKNAPGPQLPPVKSENVELGSATPPQQPPPKPKKCTHRKTKTTESAPTQAAKDAVASTAATQQAAAGEPPEMSPIGQLSSAGDRSGVPTRREIQDLITATENGLKDIKSKRSLSSDEQLTETQIRTFLTKAKQALDQDDLDGANTLANKAKVLLGELTKA